MAFIDRHSRCSRGFTTRLLNKHWHRRSIGTHPWFFFSLHVLHNVRFYVDQNSKRPATVRLKIRRATGTAGAAALSRESGAAPRDGWPPGDPCRPPPDAPGPPRGDVTLWNVPAPAAGEWPADETLGAHYTDIGDVKGHIVPLSAGVCKHGLGEHTASIRTRVRGILKKKRQMLWCPLSTPVIFMQLTFLGILMVVHRDGSFYFLFLQQGSIWDSTRDCKGYP